MYQVPRQIMFALRSPQPFLHSFAHQIVSANLSFSFGGGLSDVSVRAQQEPAGKPTADKTGRTRSSVPPCEQSDGSTRGPRTHTSAVSVLRDAPQIPRRGVPSVRRGESGAQTWRIRSLSVFLRANLLGPNPPSPPQMPPSYGKGF